MKHIKITLIALTLLVGAGLMALAPEKEEAPAPFDINNYTWLAGHWTGDGFGGVSDEVWSLPADGVMMGVYRNIQDGKVQFYEFITLDETGMKLKHFNPDMMAWEEKKDFVHFELVEATPDKLTFKGLTFERLSENKMKISLKMNNNGTISTEIFNMKRERP